MGIMQILGRIIAIKDATISDEYSVHDFYGRNYLSVLLVKTGGV